VPANQRTLRRHDERAIGNIELTASDSLVWYKSSGTPDAGSAAAAAATCFGSKSDAMQSALLPERSILRPTSGGAAHICR